MKKVGVFFENLQISFRAIHSNMLRSALTILIIAIGIMALVGILTAIDSMKAKIREEARFMGANTFKIRNRGLRVHAGGNQNRPKIYKIIDYREAMSFKEQFNFDALTSVNIHATGIATIKYKSNKTNPNVSIVGGDENYIYTSGNTIAEGRNFTKNEILYGANVVIIGSEIANLLFQHISPLNKSILIGSARYRIIGITKEKGSSFGFSGDRRCIIPVSNVRQTYSRPNMNYTIEVMVNDPKLLLNAISEATGTFRIVRNLKPGDLNNFDIIQSNSIAEMIIEQLKTISIGATIIGLITLLGAAVGLMNIMLVSVSERTREIGTRKAIGATRATIKRQFLTESIIIGQMGGILGILLGIIIGNTISSFLDGVFIIPWGWIFGGILLCFLVGVASGYLPAVKASKLDPIEALRYE